MQEPPQVAPRVKPASLPQVQAERRRRQERRALSLWGFIIGSLRPRRRDGRRATDRHALVDWHEPHLLAMAVCILILSCTDAFLTLNILMLGGEELNPIMAWLLGKNLFAFTAVKMTLTGLGVVILVATARAKFFRVFTVSKVLHWFLAGYLLLIGYEWMILQRAL